MSTGQFSCPIRSAINLENKCLSTPARMAYKKKTDMASVTENVEKLAPSYTGGGNVKQCSCFAKQSDSSSQ